MKDQAMMQYVLIAASAVVAVLLYKRVPLVATLFDRLLSLFGKSEQTPVVPNVVSQVQNTFKPVDVTKPVEAVHPLLQDIKDQENALLTNWEQKKSEGLAAFRRDVANLIKSYGKQTNP